MWGRIINGKIEVKNRRPKFIKNGSKVIVNPTEKILIDSGFSKIEDIIIPESTETIHYSFKYENVNGKVVKVLVENEVQDERIQKSANC